MKNKIFIILNIVVLLFQLYECGILTYNNEICINEYSENFESNFENDDEYILEELIDEKNRYTITIESKPYKFTNNNSELIYIFETDSNDLEMNLNNSQALKRLNKLEYNNFLTIKSKESKPVEIKITSIPNSNVLIEQLTKNNYDELKMKRKFSNVYIIDTKEDTNLISLFDSFEDYNEVYYTKYSAKNMSPKDINPMKQDKFTKIDKGKLITLDKNSTYIIINKVFEYYFSSFEYFIAPKEKIEKNVYLHGNNEKHLYLDINSTGGNFIIDTNDIADKRLIRLSTKTKDSKITINENYTLDKNNLYYELKKGQELKFKVEEKEALIEFLYNFGNEISYNYIEENNKALKNATKVSILLKLDFHGDYIIKFESNLNKAFGVSICGKIGKGNYHYYSSECQSALIFGFSYEETIKKEKIQNIVLKENESYNLYINIIKTDLNQTIYLTYYPANTITNFVESNLNSANFSNTELLHNTTYKYQIEGDDKYIFDLTIDNKDNKAMYTPIYVMNNKTTYNELHFEVKNEEKNKNSSVYINYRKNWPEGYVKIRIIAHKAEKILTSIYISSGVFIAAFLVLSIIPIVIIIRKRKENSETSDVELLNN